MGSKSREVRLSFLNRHVVDTVARQFALSSEEVLLLNPNTGTLPIFRTRRDAEITLACYRKHPILIRDGAPDGNPWGLRFATLFHMSNESDQFRTEEDLTDLGASFDGWAWKRGSQRWLPLYEAKMVAHYDHRFSTYAGATDAQLRMQTLPRLTQADHADAQLEARPRYWVDESSCRTLFDSFGISDRCLGWREITGTQVWRTMVPAVIPASAAGDSFLIALPADDSDLPIFKRFGRR